MRTRIVFNDILPFNGLDLYDDLRKAEKGGVFHVLHKEILGIIVHVSVHAGLAEKEGAADVSPAFFHPFHSLPGGPCPAEGPVDHGISPFRLRIHPPGKVVHVAGL